MALSLPLLFASLQARLDSAAAPAAGLSTIPAPDGGGGGIGDLSLTTQGEAPGTPMAKSTKMFYPVFVEPTKDACLLFIGMGATFCL
jgi:hypothetical protein